MMLSITSRCVGPTVRTASRRPDLSGTSCRGTNPRVHRSRRWHSRSCPGLPYAVFLGSDVIATGGTIAGQARGSGQLTGAQLVEAVPGTGRRSRRFTVEEFSRIGSSAMTPDHWLRLVDSTSTTLCSTADQESGGGDRDARHRYHGGDRLLPPSHRRRRQACRDGRVDARVDRRLGRRARESAGGRPGRGLSPRREGTGTLVVLNDEIHSARDVRKTDNNRVEHVRVVGVGSVLGIVDDRSGPIPTYHFATQSHGGHLNYASMCGRLQAMPNVAHRCRLRRQ